jgi:phosphoenolpyruvate carboxykinase (ATP)
MSQAIDSTQDSSHTSLDHPRERPRSDILDGDGVVLFNLPRAALVEHALRRREGELTHQGAVVFHTGKYTGRSPKDKFIVREPGSEANIDWGPINQPFEPARYDAIEALLLKHLSDREVFVIDAFAGSDPEHRLPIRVYCERAYHALFARQLFIEPSRDELLRHSPELTIIAAPDFHAVPERDGTRSEVFILVNLAKSRVLIGGTLYAGEIKKSVFSVLNYLLPLRGVLSMHCSANVSSQGDVALFFGLSGTGKTTLSTDPQRHLIGDDEHGWSDDGVFNFEGGCYAKCIRLNRLNEPEIFQAIRFGTVLENVVVDPATRVPDFADASLTENTRAAYPIEFIPNFIPGSRGGHPDQIIFLTCDAFGVLPPVARLTPEQAMYHFLSGYTAKVAGTERGLGSEPEAVFSACFGAPFMTLHPRRYADLLGKKLRRHRSGSWLLNTGWVGGPPGKGERISLSYSRSLVEAIVSRKLNSAAFTRDPIFGLEVPTSCPNIPPRILDPRGLWSDTAAYDTAARKLSRLFDENFARFSDIDPAIRAAGPNGHESGA